MRACDRLIGRDLLVWPRVHISLSMAGRKRPRSSSDSSTDSTNKHKVGYSASWKDDFPWHVPVHDSTGSTVTGLLCSLCKQHNMKQRNGVGTWTEKPCSLLRRDLIQRPKDSKMHKEAEQLEATWLASQRDGGLRQALSARVTVQRKALIGALNLMYWLAKQEIAHTTKFNSLKYLAIQPGCDYLRELSIGKNAQYSSEQIISEELQSLSLVIEEKILSDLQSSDFFALMTDESTDIAILKQLVLVGRYLTDSGVKTSFLHIGDIMNSKAQTSEGAILHYLGNKTLQITKLCAFGSDSGSVMTGRLTGVAVRLQGHSPNMIAVHCVNLCLQHMLQILYHTLNNSSPSFKPFFTFIRIVLCVWPMSMQSRNY